jgi:hypothetical protein
LDLFGHRSQLLVLGAAESIVLDDLLQIAAPAQIFRGEVQQVNRLQHLRSDLNVWITSIGKLIQPVAQPLLATAVNELLCNSALS